MYIACEAPLFHPPLPPSLTLPSFPPFIRFPCLPLPIPTSLFLPTRFLSSLVRPKCQRKEEIPILGLWKTRRNSRPHDPASQFPEIHAVRLILTALLMIFPIAGSNTEAAAAEKSQLYRQAGKPINDEFVFFFQNK